MNVNDVISLIVGISKLASYVLAFFVLRRLNPKSRRTSLLIAAIYSGAGLIALYLLPDFTGAHYDYLDVVFIEDNKMRFVPMDLNFVTNHLGLALCTGALLSYLLELRYQTVWIVLIGLMTPIVGEFFMRFGRWWSLVQQTIDRDTKKSVFSESAMAISGLGPSISAGVFVAFALLIMVSSSKYVRATNTGKA